MIRNDLKENLKGKDVNEIFLEYRPGIDQPGYRVGKIGEEVVVLNESSGEIMDYFYDDVPDKEWFSLGFMGLEYENYEINKNNAMIKNTKTGKISKGSKRSDGYIRFNSKANKTIKLFYIHRCLGFYFYLILIQKHI